jgi:hypothetical protein
MRTTISIDDDVLMAARDLAARHNKTVGEVISALARQGLRAGSTNGNVRNGAPLLPVRPGATPVTLELVNRLRDGFPG